MTRDEASSMVQGFFRLHGLNSRGLNSENLGGASVGEYQIYFEYEPAEGTLKCSALIYRFHDQPKPGVIEGFKAEGKSVDTGGGDVEYEPGSNSIYLSRTYSSIVKDTEFAEDLDRLMKASAVFGDEVLERVADRLMIDK